ncbi:MAG: YIP1 family protein [Ignavibacteriaceae bacterium]|nr:YIP1 family protein [Ignavibacteriaceae bacterium]
MNLFERAKNILITPKTEWEVIKNEQTSVSDLFTKYVLILALIPAVAGFIGQSLVGISLGPFGSYKMPVERGLLYLVLYYAMTVGAVYLMAFIVDALAPSFGSQKNMLASLKVVVYSYTAAWVAGIFQIFPLLGFLGVIGGLYGLYLLYLGLQTVKETPQDKLVGYFIVIIIVSIVIYFVIGMIVTAIAFGGMMMDGFKGL